MAPVSSIHQECARSDLPKAKPIGPRPSKTCSHSPMAAASAIARTAANLVARCARPSTPASCLGTATRRSWNCASSLQQLLQQRDRIGINVQHATVQTAHVAVRDGLIEPLQQSIEVTMHVE